ncbi:hypothetical protein [Polaromonas sp. CG9_12]|nr:hypothetical protein [Polaromonas sp. CG9_12]
MGGNAEDGARAEMSCSQPYSLIVSAAVAAPRKCSTLSFILSSN